MAVVEAKKFSAEVSAVVGQAERYSLGFQAGGSQPLAAPPGWDDAKFGAFPGLPALHAKVTGATHYRVPFVCAPHGRPYHRQFETRSGVWFRDLRPASNHAGALAGWHTPDGLLQLLARDVDAAELQLQAEPFGYLNLRNRQVHFKPFRVIYRVVGQNIVVLVIADGRRNLKALLERRLLGAP